MFLIILIIFFLIIYLIWRNLPQILMWLVRRRVQSTMRQAYGQQPRSGRRQQGAPRQQQRQPGRPGKIITRDVGEYVEFEEIAVTVAETRSEASRPKIKPEAQVSDADWEEI